MSYSPTYTSFGFPRPTPAVSRLMVVNVIVFVVNAVTAGAASEWLALSWDGLFAGYGLGVLRLITYQFVHSFDDPWHLLGNGIYLYFFGGLCERSLLGYVGVLKVYLLGGIAGGLLHMGMCGLLWGSSAAVIGASGSCFGLLVHAVCTRPRMELRLVFFNCQLVFLGAVLVALGFYGTWVELVRGRPDRVSHGAHLGGALLGFAAWRWRWFHDYRDAEVVSPLAGLLSWWRRRRQQQHTDRAAVEQQELDRILEKIQQQGLPSLSPAERRALDRISQRKKRG